MGFASKWSILKLWESGVRKLKLKFSTSNSFPLIMSQFGILKRYTLAQWMKKLVIKVFYTYKVYFIPSFRNSNYISLSHTKVFEIYNQIYIDFFLNFFFFKCFPKRWCELKLTSTFWKTSPMINKKNCFNIQQQKPWKLTFVAPAPS